MTLTGLADRGPACVSQDHLLPALKCVSIGALLAEDFLWNRVRGVGP